MMAGVSSSESPVAPGAPLGQSLMTRGDWSLADDFCWPPRAGIVAKSSEAMSGRVAQSIFEIIKVLIHTAPGIGRPILRRNQQVMDKCWRRSDTAAPQYMPATKTDQSSPLLITTKPFRF